jgi:hypothetical protein
MRIGIVAAFEAHARARADTTEFLTGLGGVFFFAIQLAPPANIGFPSLNWDSWREVRQKIPDTQI